MPSLTLRAVLKDGEPWFVAKDVCAALDLKPDATNGSYQNHMRRLEEHEYMSIQLPSANGTRKQYIISESGLYALIMRSRKPEAIQFRKWVTSVVLPAIRKDGSYIMGEEKVASGGAGCRCLAQKCERVSDKPKPRFSPVGVTLAAPGRGWSGTAQATGWHQ